MNLNIYKNAKKEIQEWFVRQKGNNIIEHISIYAVTNHIPVLVVAFFVGEITDWPPELLDNIESIIKCYGYTNIKGIPASFPRRKV